MPYCTMNVGERLWEDIDDATPVDTVPSNSAQDLVPEAPGVLSYILVSLTSSIDGLTAA